MTMPGAASRRAVILHGRDLYARRALLGRIVRGAIRSEPDMLWQFVLAPLREEPLDLLDDLIRAIRRFPPHLLDRYASAAGQSRIVSRRLFVQLPGHRRFDPGWVAAAEDLLAQAFD